MKTSERAEEEHRSSALFTDIKQRGRRLIEFVAFAQWDYDRNERTVNC